MLDKLIYYSIHHKLMVAIFTLMIIIAGVYSIMRLPIDAVPDITNNQVQIITRAPAQSAMDIERLVTFPLEQSMTTIPSIAEIRSFSRFGLSVVTIVFDEDTDIYWARQQVSERLATISELVPSHLGIPEMAPLTTGLGEIYQYTLRPQPGFEDRFDATELRTLQDWIVRRQLLGIPGVADVSSYGGFLKQYEIAISPDKLRSYNLSLSDVLTALETNNQNTGGAYIDKNPKAYFIRSEGMIQSIEDIEQISITQTNSRMPILIRDVATIQIGHAIRYGALTYQDKEEGVGGIVLMLKGENANAVVERVKNRIEQIQKTLPEGITIQAFLDRSELVNRTIRTVETNLIEGALIVIFVLILFLGNVRAGLIVASVIPLAMLFAVTCMYAFGVSGNLMSLGAIDFGLIVDGAVIIVEATMHHLGIRKLSRALSQQEMDEEVYQSASAIRSSAAFGEIIILIVYIPILALVGIEGKMFKPMAQTVSFAILGAFILSLTYVPMMSALMLSKKPQSDLNFSTKMMHFFERLYIPIITNAIRHRGKVVGVTLVLFIVSIIGFMRMGGEFLPTLDEGDFSIETRVLTGSSLSYSIEASQKAADVLLTKFPDEVKEVIGKIGTSEIPTDPMPIEACDLIVTLTPPTQWTKAKDREGLAEAMSKELEVITGVSFGFQQPIQMRFNELMSGVKQDIAVKIFGEDLETLTSLSKEVAQIINTVDGARDLYVEEVTGLTQIVVKPNRHVMAKHGVSIEAINTAINTAFAGQPAGLVFEGEKRFDIVVRFDNINRQHLQDVDQIFISTSSGYQIPLHELADVSFAVGPNQIQREDAKRRIIVGFNVRGRDIQSVVDELNKKIAKQISFPTGYYVTYGGQFENLQEAQARLSIAVPAALALILLLLYTTFGSLKQSLIIFTAIPMSAIGGVWALYLRDMPFSISAGIGFIALFGVAVLNGIVLLASFNRLKDQGESLEHIIINGTTTRLRPVLMTATVASLGFLPMALASTAGAEVQKPLATVVIGGLVTATILTLIVLPCVYHYSQTVRWPRKGKGVVATLLLLFCSIGSYAQQQPNVIETITLEDALQRAKDNHPSLKAAALQTAYQQAQKKTSSHIGKTSINYMRGQYNSYFKEDGNITISQQLPFPTVLSSQSKLAQERINVSTWEERVAENTLLYEVTKTYYELVYLKSFEALLLQQDSILQLFSSRTARQYELGESTLLQSTRANVVALENRNKLLRTRADIQSLAVTLQYWLQHSTPVIPADDTLKEITLQDTSVYRADNNPLVGLSHQYIALAQQEKKVSQQQLLPDILLGYFNQTLIGSELSSGAIATRKDRFQGFEIGVAIPLWVKPYRARVTANRILTEQREEEATQQEQQLATTIATAWQAYAKAKSTLSFYETDALPQATLMVNQATRSFQQGEISFLEYSTLLTQGIQLQQTYLMTLNEVNQALLYVTFLTGNL
jgi:cobalt-zinc-cadmium resistance protein CzcA